jgi:hypothetical protein
MKIYSAIVLSAFIGQAAAFMAAPMQAKHHAAIATAAGAAACTSTKLCETKDETTEATAAAPVADKNARVIVPITLDSMVKEAAEAMSEAKAAGIKRQIIRLMLPRDAASGQLGQYYEDDVEIFDRQQDTVLVPPDETWQGGIMQLYRAAAPTCQELLRIISGDVGGVPPKLIEDRSVDDSGVDGVGLIMSQNRDPIDDISCFVQPMQETVDAIESISKQAGERLVVLANPQWRNVDDALDSASKSGGVFGSLASFLGGKGGSLKRLQDAGFTDVFMIEGYVCKGGNVRLMKRFDSDWVVFAENDSETDFIRMGTSATRPSYQDVDKMLDDNGVSLKYARDIGLAPKLE